jgi:hypothetical protein
MSIRQNTAFNYLLLSYSKRILIQIWLERMNCLLLHLKLFLFSFSSFFNKSLFDSIAWVEVFIRYPSIYGALLLSFIVIYHWCYRWFWLVLTNRLWSEGTITQFIVNLFLFPPLLFLLQLLNIPLILFLKGLNIEILSQLLVFLLLHSNDFFFIKDTSFLVLKLFLNLLLLLYLFNLDFFLSNLILYSLVYWYSLFNWLKFLGTLL